jgi:hypothetical protein
MPRPSAERVREGFLAETLTRSSSAEDAFTLLLAVANESIELLRPRVRAWNRIAGDPLTDATLGELKQGTRQDLQKIVDGGAEQFSRGTSEIKLRWWFTPAGARTGIAALVGGRGLQVEVATDDLHDYVDWGLLLLLLRDPCPLRRCARQDCGRFYVAARADRQQFCGDPECVRARAQERQQRSRQNMRARRKLDPPRYRHRVVTGKRTVKNRR